MVQGRNSRRARWPTAGQHNIGLDSGAVSPGHQQRSTTDYRGAITCCSASGPTPPWTACRMPTWACTDPSRFDNRTNTIFEQQRRMVGARVQWRPHGEPRSSDTDPHLRPTQRRAAASVDPGSAIRTPCQKAKTFSPRRRQPWSRDAGRPFSPCCSACRLRTASRRGPGARPTCAGQSGKDLLRFIADLHPYQRTAGRWRQWVEASVCVRRACRPLATRRRRATSRPRVGSTRAAGRHTTAR